jgi:hypothetical protein
MLPDPLSAESIASWNSPRDRPAAAKLDFGLSIEPVNASIYRGEDGETTTPP